MTQTITRKLGGSLFFGGQAMAEGDVPASLLGVDVACIAEHKESGERKTFALVWIDREQGRYEMWAPGDGTCTGWKLGTWIADISYTQPAGGTDGRPLVLDTESFQIVIEKKP